MPASADGIVWNVPNRLSAARIVLAILCFVTICLEWYLLSLVLFVIASATDWLDGYWARKYNQITQLGRILDPFADKVIICGTFILLGAVEGSLVPAWVAVLITARELLVTALRSLIEGRSMDFSAKWAGKWKMVAQCAVVILSLWRLGRAAAWQPPSLVLDNILILMVLVAIISTVYSGWGYVKLAIVMLRPADNTTDSANSTNA
ncbi:CDP-diacylglycerol--glycerol-3-phosphate 3-phosphatidyltransferase [Aeoliella mucimassa]|uniref:CDP-diacylglycerol--glycerol-3-phosphate 3-phosphatidyltransferase n=1 Tax=Aeoliella mucimassa TaxID=2527972 RepID=A0A518AQS0_9BACT|nr:CDP-diacylglycerol--glycerol-3-phosphate 3-phosphatidyltransferase [Aeoliella mucimassa]QDU57055.1 CDP-diacylglycerol--glycerol-3-phosphate 3-phosphatidyltransferase [Aeoliella mucimassa]